AIAAPNQLRQVDRIHGAHRLLRGARTIALRADEAALHLVEHTAAARTQRGGIPRSQLRQVNNVLRIAHDFTPETTRWAASPGCTPRMGSRSAIWPRPSHRPHSVAQLPTPRTRPRPLHSGHPTQAEGMTLANLTTCFLLQRQLRALDW